jgi:hypothetical protein
MWLFFLKIWWLLQFNPSTIGTGILFVLIVHHQGKKKPPTGYHYQLNQIWARYERDMMKIWKWGSRYLYCTSEQALDGHFCDVVSLLSFLCPHLFPDYQSRGLELWNLHGMKRPCQGGSYCAFLPSFLPSYVDVNLVYP